MLFPVFSFPFPFSSLILALTLGAGPFKLDYVLYSGSHSLTQCILALAVLHKRIKEKQSRKCGKNVLRRPCFERVLVPCPPTKRGRPLGVQIVLLERGMRAKQKKVLEQQPFEK